MTKGIHRRAAGTKGARQMAATVARAGEVVYKPTAASPKEIDEKTQYDILAHNQRVEEAKEEKRMAKLARRYEPEFLSK